jgi:Helix-turn-helix
MTDGLEKLEPIPLSVIWDDYYEALHVAYNALRETFENSGLSQDELSELSGIDKSLISKRLNGSENLTIKTLSHMGSAMGHRVVVGYQPYDMCGTTNYYVPTPVIVASSTVVTGVTSTFQVTDSSSTQIVSTSVTGAPAATTTLLSDLELKRA